MPKRLALVILDGVLDSVFGVTVDVLAVANRIAAIRGDPATFDVRLVAAASAVTSGSGRRIAGDTTFKSSAKFDVVMVPGINVPLREELEAALVREDVVSAGRFLIRHAARGALICASCAGTFVLAETGLLDGGVATTSWWLAPLFRARYPRVDLREDAVVSPNGSRMVTAGAALSQIDLMLWLVRRIAGPEVAARCARLLVLDERPSQTRYALVDHLSHDSEEVRRAERFVRKNLQRPLTIAEIANAAHVSPRTLARRTRACVGLSPLGLLQRLRVERAAHLLGTTALSFDEITQRVGYEDPGALRGLLRRELGATARSLRPRISLETGRRLGRARQNTEAS